MPLVKPIVTDRGMNRTAVPRPVRPIDNEHHAGHRGAHQQAGDAELRDDAGDDDDERTGRAGDLAARTAERRNDNAGNDRRVDAGFRL